MELIELDMLQQTFRAKARLVCRPIADCSGWAGDAPGPHGFGMGCAASAIDASRVVITAAASSLSVPLGGIGANILEGADGAPCPFLLVGESRYLPDGLKSSRLTRSSSLNDGYASLP
jgi:hypothetical protein